MAFKLREYSLGNLCYLLESKNDINRRRRQAWDRARRLEKQWCQLYSHRVTGCLWLDNGRYHWFSDAQYVWYKPKAQEECKKHMGRYEKLKKFGKKRTKRIRKIAKKLNVRLRWDDSGYCSHIIQSDDAYAEARRIHRTSFQSIANHQLFEDIVLNSRND